MSLFGKKSYNQSQLDIEKQLFDRELELYRKEKYQKLNEEIENTKLKRLKEVAEIELACHRQHNTNMISILQKKH